MFYGGKEEEGRGFNHCYVVIIIVTRKCIALNFVKINENEAIQTALM
jgi:hypothetical protein